MKKIFAALRLAFMNGEVVRVKRNPEFADSEVMEGYIVGLSETFVLLHLIDGDAMNLNGYTALPLYEIVGLLPDQYNSFPHRALRLKGISPMAQPDILLLDFPGLLSSINTHFPLVTIHIERLIPETCYIGRVAKMTEKSVTLREIDPSAQWKRIEKYRFKDITRIDFDGGYENALWSVSEYEKRTAEEAPEQK